MASKKLAKTDLTHSQKNASDDVISVSLGQSSDDTGSIDSHSLSLGSDETISILSRSQIHGSAETSSIYTRSFRNSSDETKSIDSRSVSYGSDETKSIDSRSVNYGSDETKSIDSRSVRYGSDETKSIDSHSVSYGSDESKSIDSRSVRYRSDKTKMKNELGKSERQKKGRHALSSVFEMCDVHEGKLLDFHCANHNVSGCSLCMKLTHGSCKDVQPRSAQGVTGATKQLETIVINEDNNKSKDTDRTSNTDGEVGWKSADIATRGDDEVGGKSADFATRGDNEVGGKSADIATGGDGEVGGKSADIATRGDDEVGGKSADIATRGDDEVSGKSADIATRGGDEVGGKSTDIATTGGDEVGGKSANIATENGDAVGGQLKTQSQDGEVAGARSSPRHLYSVTGSRDINVRVEGDDRTCYIRDICQLPDGRLLMTDWMNNKLKLLDQSYTVIDHCDMPDSPASICLCDKEACVGQHWVSRTLQFVSIQEKMEISRKMKLNQTCKGLVYRDGELYVSDGSANIHVYNKVGNQLRVYNIDTVVGEYFNTEYLTVSMDGRQLYMTRMEYLVCMDRQSGEVIWRVKEDNGSGYRGVCVDKDNNVMVCDSGRGEIVQYSGDGEKMRVIVDGLFLPRAICFDQDSKTLLVGMWESDVIKMFDLK